MLGPECRLYTSILDKEKIIKLFINILKYYFSAIVICLGCIKCIKYKCKKNKKTDVQVTNPEYKRLLPTPAESAELELAGV
jgi:predicted membrane protein